MEIRQSITIRFPKRILLQNTDVIPIKYQNIYYFIAEPTSKPIA